MNVSALDPARMRSLAVEKSRLARLACPGQVGSCQGGGLPKIFISGSEEKRKYLQQESRQRKLIKAFKFYLKKYVHAPINLPGTLTVISVDAA